MRTRSDKDRFSRYHSVVNILLAKDRFRKSDIYEVLKEEKKIFAGRIIEDLVRDGYLNKDGFKTNPQYSWSAKKEGFNAHLWIDRRISTLTIKQSPSDDRPRERLLRIGPSGLKISELLAILIRSGLQGESATQAGEKLAALFGIDLEKLSLQTKEELKQISKAIGETAYCQIMAGLELGKRLGTQRLAESAPSYRIRNTSDALILLR
jgi:DNA repair protein RadC